MTPILRLLCAFSLAALLPAGNIFAQDAAPKVPAFDVVSVKPNNSGNGMIRIMMGDDRCEMTNVTVAIMMQNAFDMKPSQIEGLPSWAKADHFDIQCKIVDADKELLKKLKPEERRPMYQALLKDRFGLQTHLETKNLPLYELVVAKGGPKMEALPPQTDAEKDAEKAAPRKEGKMGRGSMMSRRSPEGFQLDATGVKMVGLANMLSTQAGRIVVDKTELPGEYTFQLRWAPEDGPAGQRPDAAAEALPSVFTAVQEQLGLRLVSAKGDVQILIVDHIEHPGEN